MFKSAFRIPLFPKSFITSSLFKNGFYNCFEILSDRYMSGKYNGQTKAEFTKNFIYFESIFKVKNKITCI